MLKFTIIIICTVACVYAIVGGKEAADGQFPYQVSLRNRNRHICGGSILDKNTILTSATCAGKWYPYLFTVVVGTNHISEGGVSHQVKEIRVHENYNPIEIHNDIAILKLATNIEFNDKVQMVQLEPKVIGGDEAVTLSGWGLTSYPGTAPSKLQFIKLISLTVAKCQQLLSSYHIVDSEICTLTKVGEGACNGDSGGPLVLSGTSFQLGIASWVIPCAKGKPDVYTRVSSFIDWIEANRN